MDYYNGIIAEWQPLLLRRGWWQVRDKPRYAAAEATQERHFLSERSVKLLIDSLNMTDLNVAAFLDRYQQSQTEPSADCTFFVRT